MVQESKINVEFFASGYCTAHARFVNPKSGNGMTRFYAVWALIRHPHMGNILFDAGYSSNFMKSTEKWPDRLYRWVTPVTLQDHETALSVLASKGILPEEIDYFVISHFHADHICALNEFPTAKIICTEAAWQQASALSGFSAVRKAILKELIPPDLNKRMLFLEELCRKELDKESGLIFYHAELFEPLRFVLLPGHARGMIGFHLPSESGDVLYATDAAWDRDAFLAKVLPNPIVQITFDSWTEFKDTQLKLLKYLEHHPNTEILFTHCPQTLKRISNEV